MKLRNGKLYGEYLYEISIDFDESSREWRKNKQYIGNGWFEYKYS